MNTKKISGFSLIELMIVIAIIGILTTLALPSYRDYLMRARFTELLTVVEPFKLAVSLAIQQGYSLNEIKNNRCGIPAEPKPTLNLASLTVENGIITAIGSSFVNHATYILKPASDGNHWLISGTCIKLGLCEF